MRLDWRLRWAIYLDFTVLFATGAIIWGADPIRAWSGLEGLTPVSLMIHGGFAMLALLAIGALIPIHALRGWRARRNRISGVTIAAVNAALVATAFGLYYLGGELARAWASTLHLWIGFALPVVVAWHVWRGRRQRHKA